MIEHPSVKKQVIRNHYDISTLFYRLLWGPHIHHGYWEGNESPQLAQVQLTNKLANLAEIRAGSVVYDIGCGMGGSSQWLAKHRSCQVTGVTLSPVQRLWAASSAKWNRVSPAPKFLCKDAEQVELGPNSADY
ncbi:MAG: SAM-dependent methyltransferase, partial [Pirellula sp.]